jgi:predicted TPR repeat methyltransferase
MAAQDQLSPSSAAAAYDRKAEEYDWRGPEVAFGLSYSFVNCGESVLDIGVGTGLSSVLFHKAGLHVYGMDVSTEMLEACRSKGFTTDLKKHDLTVQPYPYDAASLDHAVCLGVLNSFRDLQLVFREVARIVRDGGVFVFAVGDRAPGEEPEFVVGREHTQSDSTVTMYRHGTEVINRLLDDNDFELLRCLEFPVPMDRERAKILRAKAYVARRKGRI